MTDVDCQMELAAELGIAVANLRGLARSAAVRPDKKRAMASLRILELVVFRIAPGPGTWRQALRGL